jgi:hypothetical protein
MMRSGARLPEELDVLLEDAFVMRDRRAVMALFESYALVADGTAQEARGVREIASWAAEAWSSGLTYVAGAPRVLQARDIALVLTPHGIGVVHRDGDRAWRYAIALLSFDDTTAKEEK